MECATSFKVTFVSSEVPFLVPPSVLFPPHPMSVQATSSTVSNVKNIPLDNLDGRVIFKMANAGDREVNIVIDNYTGLIARNLFNLQAILDVQKIAVGGGISSEPLFINGIKKNLKMYGEMADSSIPLPEIVKCKFGRDANMIGALVKLQENENT